ncbi:MAG: hypothetical protein KKG00_06605 [Bacteroidetes bacterium]|nr:hypothetical protein [Bacteroidota bacterium]
MNLSERLQKLTIRINRIGSGILFIHPNDVKHYYVFTANHCLENNPIFSLVEYEETVGVFKKIIVDKANTFADPKNDFAIILLDKADFPLDQSAIPSLSIGRIMDESGTFQFRGYPAALAGEATKLEARFIEGNAQGFKIRVTTNLSDSSGELAASSVAGFSGSGVVLDVGDQPSLVGIVTHLGNSAGSFNQVHCCNFSMINQLFNRYSLPQLTLKDVAGGLDDQTSETLYSSLLKVQLPENVFVGEINIARSELFDYAKREEKYIPFQLDSRQFIYELLKMKGLRLSGDFAVYNNKIVTFYDLTQRDNSFHHLIDQGTVECLAVDEYCSTPDSQRTFVNLLNNCLSRKLHHLNVSWKHEDKTFIFGPQDEGLGKRQIKWQGKVKSERTVFEAKMQSKTNPDEPDKLLHCTHFAFQGHFRQFGQQWFFNIMPDSYATWNGSKKHPWRTQELAAYKKKNERNGEVFTHVRFLAYFLTQNKDFFVNFDDLVCFDNAPKLADEYWHIKKEKKEK